MKKALACGAMLLMSCNIANADLISEFEGNPAGTDPANQSVELLGTPGAMFDLWLVSLESDPGTSQGIVDRASNVMGTYDALGLAVVSVPDLENPSFTLILADDFTGMIGDDLDTDDDGTLDITNTLIGVNDAIGVIEDAGDPDFADDFGGTYFVGVNSADPGIVFRDASSGAVYFNVGADTYDAAGNIVTGFSADPLATTFGAINPTLAVIPEPNSLALLGLVGCAGFIRRRR